MKKIIKVGSRKSLLAMKQTEIVVNRLKNKFPEYEFEIIGISTKGDEILNKALSTFGGKGVFTKELENALYNKTIDMAVHSAKDMPSKLDDAFEIGAVLEREDARDTAVTTNGIKLAQLPKGSIIGTGSLRREIQIKKINPEVEIKLIRGNIHTRLNKLKNNEYDCIILAMAGLSRMELLSDNSIVTEPFDTDIFLPAAGQGILTVETRKGDMREFMSAIHSVKTAFILAAERAFLDEIGGSCNSPIGAYAHFIGNDIIEMNGIFLVGNQLIYKGDTDNQENAIILGKRIAQDILNSKSK